jgi:hypothetical protein
MDHGIEGIGQHPATSGHSAPCTAGAKQTLLSCAKLNRPYTIASRGSLDRAQANLGFVGVHSLSCDAK